MQVKSSHFASVEFASFSVLRLVQAPDHHRARVGSRTRCFANDSFDFPFRDSKVQELPIQHDSKQVITHRIPCCAVPCCAARCCAARCCPVLCCAVQCCAVLCWSGLGWAGRGWAGLLLLMLLCCAVQCRAVPCRAVPC